MKWALLVVLASCSTPDEISLSPHAERYDYLGFGPDKFEPATGEGYGLSLTATWKLKPTKVTVVSDETHTRPVPLAEPCPERLSRPSKQPGTLELKEDTSGTAGKPPQNPVGPNNPSAVDTGLRVGEAVDSWDWTTKILLGLVVALVLVLFRRPIGKLIRRR